MLVAEGRKNMLFALLGSAILSFAPLIYILTETNPITGAFFRMLYALQFLLIIVYFSRSIDTRDFKSRQLTFVAGLFLALDFLAYHTAIDYIGTGIATMIGNSQVIIVTLISWKFLGEKPNRSILIVLPIVILGLVLISGIWDNEAYGENPSFGVIGGIFAAIFYSSFLIIYRYSNKEKSPAQNLQLDTTVGAAFGLFIGHFTIAIYKCRTTKYTTILSKSCMVDSFGSFLSSLRMDSYYICTSSIAGCPYFICSSVAARVNNTLGSYFTFRATIFPAIFWDAFDIRFYNHCNLIW